MNKLKPLLYAQVRLHFAVDGEKLFRIDKDGAKIEVKPKINHSRGYFRIGFDRENYYAHRILYCLYHKTDIDSSLVIDHIDGNRINNSIHNLRLVTFRENLRNRKVKCVSGFPNVGKSGNNWRVRVYVGREIRLGSYKNIKDALEVSNVANDLMSKNLSADEIEKAILPLQNSLSAKKPA